MKKIINIAHAGFVICLSLSLIYALIALMYCFWHKASIYVSLSVKPVVAQILAFPIFIGFFGFVFSILGLLVCRKTNDNIVSVIRCFPFILILAASALFALSGSNMHRDMSSVFDNGTIKIVEWNAHNSLSEDNVKKIFHDYDADVAVFPELGGYTKAEDANQRVADIFVKTGIDPDLYDVFTSAPNAGDIAPVTIIIKKAFARYTAETENAMTMYGTLYLKTSAGEAPDIIGLHTAPPLPTMMTFWRRDLDFVCGLVQKNPNAVIVGDFNATMWHGPLNNVTTHCDALSYFSSFANGTWPAGFYPLFRSCIDHVLFPNEEYNVKNIEMQTLTNSDHVAIFVELGKKYWSTTHRLGSDEP